MGMPDIEIPTMADAVAAALVGLLIGFVLSGILAFVQRWRKRHPRPQRPEKIPPPISRRTWWTLTILQDADFILVMFVLRYAIGLGLVR